jgi:hypothetical protein
VRHGGAISIFLISFGAIVGTRGPGRKGPARAENRDIPLARIRQSC